MQNNNVLGIKGLTTHTHWAYSHSAHSLSINICIFSEYSSNKGTSSRQHAKSSSNTKKHHFTALASWSRVCHSCTFLSSARNLRLENERVPLQSRWRQKILSAKLHKRICGHCAVQRAVNTNFNYTIRKNSGPHKLVPTFPARCLSKTLHAASQCCRQV